MGSISSCDGLDYLGELDYGQIYKQRALAKGSRLQKWLRNHYVHEPALFTADAMLRNRLTFLRLSCSDNSHAEWS